ncbi:MAG: 1-deoxy-D-xylulose-5-phosphate synthase [Candidatus Tectimicrobiota bacterium]|nr:MAG: 1-deoxy-D-xylulose-5-phosphate synthase [Candidatus Tectomicrobia bacterium]
MAEALPYGLTEEGLAILQAVERRLLWLTTYLLHDINKLRPNPDGMKVGGHQASSASLVSLLTALYGVVLRPHDQVALKPHAAPAFHALQYLLGWISLEQLRSLRDLGGLQAYPNRVKDPGVTISTASAGLGAAATIFGALAQRYVRDHFGSAPPGRYVALVGDAELDEGNIPEALGEASAYDLRSLWWIIDCNRQSLDRVVPAALTRQIGALFAAKGWRVLELRYGSQQEACFRHPQGAWLKEWLDTCDASEYQSLMTLPGAALRRALQRWGERHGKEVAPLLASLDDAALKALVYNVGGHDLRQILITLARAEELEGPLVIIAHTIKGWGLPLAGHLENHAALLTEAQLAALQAEHDIAPGAEWDRFPPGSAEHAWLQQSLARRGFAGPPAALTPRLPAVKVPETLGLRHPATTSTQAALGQLLVALSELPVLGERLVTVSPDVAVSTGLGGWINRRGVYAPQPRPDYWQEHGVETLLRWQEGPHGQHLELGIAEHNFFLALAMLGLAPEMQGEMLWPLGTVYDPFVGRGLDALKYATYAQAKFILVGTPSGLALCREAGAHQSFLTPLLGLGLPQLVFYEPAYAAEVEVILCWALRQLLDRQGGESVYLRLSTRPLPQEVRGGAAAWRRQVLAGGYWLRDYRGAPDYRQAPRVHLFASGAVLAEALAASEAAREDGIYANVINITSADRLFRDWMAFCRGARSLGYLDELLPPEERQVPAVTVVDGHPLTLAWLGNVLQAPLHALGVTAFGESGALPALYHKHQIDAEAILGALTRLLFTKRGQATFLPAP